MNKRIEQFHLLPCSNGEMPFSFTHMLASSLKHTGCPLSYEEITGASGFAFRLWVETKTQCPSAMSVFDFELLRKGIELTGYDVVYVSRLWHEEDVEEERREEAHRAIISAVNENITPIVWDVGIPDWGVIIGYDEEVQAYDTISATGEYGHMAYAQLGRREIPILSVAIPPKHRNEEPITLARNTIKTEIEHARGHEWTERPAYESGLAAYPVWAELVRSVDQSGFPSMYYVSTYASLRRCAAAYLANLVEHDGSLHPAANAYTRVGKALCEAQSIRQNAEFPTSALLDELYNKILLAYSAEQEGVALLEQWLSGGEGIGE